MTIRAALGLVLVAIAPLGAAAQTDDTTYLQHIVEANGVIPPGRYYFRSITVDRDNVVIRGSGKENTWLVQLPASDTNAITCHKAQHVAIDSLSLDGNRSVQGAGSGIVFDNCANFQVRNVNLVNIHGNGVTAQRGSSNGSFENVEGLNIGYHLLSISESPQTRIGYLSGREIASAVINLAASPNSTLGQIVGQNTAPNDSGYGGMKVSNASDGTVIGSIHMIGFPRGLFIKDSSNVVIGHLRVANIGYQCVLIQAEAEGGRADNNVILGGLAQDCGLLQKGLPGIHFSKQPDSQSASGNRVRNLEVRDSQGRLGSLWLDEPQSNGNAVTP
ncbi:right-handed parallel beta-helix repeat-containing protein [Bradyrhizobium sp. LHD-71]|uniref:right-handed parallel beta-helix repeat-containing protein n=1 Tax=Bradyrhizobium sp. LHD-71 TaxID=3072141 RepID=UPI0028104B34|nr:right-handed parallel beta-helix repeat-containing protein [Bradyrhizobium sp. LHD-71]MDQ8730948.1 right-handed parallel beta-helix repeat-containing protein [Bradyrhizobium sp. LHD-71]